MKKFFAMILALALSRSGASQTTDTAKKTSAAINISGSVDAYYRYNLDGPEATPYNNFTSFTRTSNSFELGMASLRADHSFGKVSATIDLGLEKELKKLHTTMPIQGLLLNNCMLVMLLHQPLNLH